MENPMPAAAPKFLPALFASCIVLWALPAGAEDLKPLCSDRPGRGSGACSVESGHWQVELGLWDATFQRRSGVTTDVTSAANPVVKYGVGDKVDIEASMALFQSVRVRDALGEQTDSGVGDLFLRAKWNPAAGDDDTFNWVIFPFIKLPTASHGLGNGEVEAGLLVPLAYELGGGWSLDSTPEADLTLNESGRGYHATIVNVVGLGRDIAGGFNIGAEIWASQNFDPAGTVNQYSFGPEIAWQPNPNNQFDGGFAVGLNRRTPDLELYAGFSRRF